MVGDQATHLTIARLKASDSAAQSVDQAETGRDYESHKHQRDQSKYLQVRMLAEPLEEIQWPGSSQMVCGKELYSRTGSGRACPKGRVC